MNKMNLVVVFGGVSSEHDISCISAASILRNADADRYHIYPVGITKSGGWKLFESTDYDSVEDGSWETSEQAVPALLSPDRETHGLLVLRESGAEAIRADCVFPVLHGIGVHLADHFIFADDDYVSMRASGILQKLRNDRIMQKNAAERKP